MRRLIFMVAALLLLSGCAGTRVGGVVGHQGHHTGGVIGFSGVIPGPVVQSGSVQTWPVQAIRPVAPIIANPCAHDPGTLPAFHPGLNRRVCARPGDPNVVFERMAPVLGQGIIENTTIYHQGCRPPYITAYRRMDGAEVCAMPGDGSVVFPGRIDPFGPGCRNGGRPFGGRYVCMD